MAEPLQDAPTSSDAAAKTSRDAFVRNTLARLATAAVGIPVLLWMLYGAPRWLFPVFCLLAIARAAHELFRMMMRETPLLYAWGLSASILLASSHLGALLAGIGDPDVSPMIAAVLGDAPRAALWLGVGSTLVVTASSVLIPLVHPEPNDRAGLRLAWLVAGPFYVGALLAAVPALFLLAGGTWVVLAMALAWGSDTGAYFAGRFFGRHKLAPSISPSKTVEGALGGLAASIGFAVLGAMFFLPSLPLAHAIALAIVANVLGQAGDLVESLIKRSTGVKDSGSILPGHGGLLDRIDALMFTATTSFVYVLATGP